MFKLLKVWWYYSVLSKVLLDENGNPYDRKGLQVIKGKYTISDEWSEHSYLGEGYYASYYGRLQADMKNPFYLAKLRDSLSRFK
ncbi:hypothetical protein S140_79 [Shewanella sp. phage 1/40]|uniref:hypothetical protein n=1 Tax=Shewanella sp. phage 1/40 TaxID=1458860 RepID=UPI0004F7A76A|nr:hypothetical protein S140_79 [Shewanella sp. phage 1/40]AHK11489.1 hypothetical protein S140_79 [Shewanella sp. phage 1/40]